jgi:hypothetical protein
MTEAELLEATGLAANTALTGISLYMTIVSAYLITAFTAGSRLTRSQTFVISVGFVVGAGIFIYVVIANALRQVYFTARLSEIQTDATFYFSDRTTILIGSVLVMGIIASLKFMWDVRHPKAE